MCVITPQTTKSHHSIATLYPKAVLPPCSYSSFKRSPVASKIKSSDSPL